MTLSIFFRTDFAPLTHADLSEDEIPQRSLWEIQAREVEGVLRTKEPSVPAYCICQNAEGSDHAQDIPGMRSATIWTSVTDTRNKVILPHTAQSADSHGRSHADRLRVAP